MNKKIIIPIIIIPIMMTGIIAYTNPYLLPPEILDPIRGLRDFQQEIFRTAERNAGVPLKAQVVDTDFKVEEFITGLRQPTQISFIGNDLLILEKNQGKVRLVKNSVLQSDSVLDVEVGTNNESGLLGITSVGSSVYIYFTESTKDGETAFANNVYKYYWDGNSLTNPVLVTSLSNESSWHNGGGIVANQNGEVFFVIGDQMGESSDEKMEYRILQNYPNEPIDDSGVIIRVGDEPQILEPRNTNDPFIHYYAIGIRNSFGLAIDPITGNMWDTEAGPENFDEINLVSPKFNSGWAIVMGPANEEQKSKIPTINDFQYSDPEFSWEKTVTPTGLIFLNSDKFEKYKNQLLVGSCNSGQLFKFSLSENRSELVFNNKTLQDKVVNLITYDNGKTDFETHDEIIFGTGFGCVTDVEIGPDGYLYVTSITDNAVYRISPK